MGPLPEGVTVGDDGVARCWWGAGDPLYRSYHDTEWGRPVAEDRRLFEKLSLEGFQAGLSWLTILRKRENFRRAFQGFDPAAVAGFGAEQVERLLADPGIVRNRTPPSTTPAATATWSQSSAAWPPTSGGMSPAPRPALRSSTTPPSCSSARAPSPGR
jgi:DNA-3-methyladenine glycosylase I